MGVTAALTGLLTALIPVLFSLARYGAPSALTAAGLAAGCAAIWLITHRPESTRAATPARALLLGALAGAGFGMQLVFFKMADGASLLGIMTVARVAGVTALALVLLWTRPRSAGRGFLLAGAVSGILDTAGNLFYLRAVQLGRLDSAAVICSLYPAGTILLAAILLRERPSRRQVAGMALALGAVALLSL
jgi:drug/metabolite transporter (DMT)-like permease